MLTLNEKEYNVARIMATAYQSALDAYVKEHGNGVSNEIRKTFPFADVVDNDLRSAIEVYEFTVEKPEKYFLYIDEIKAIATTWTGQNLGSVWFGREFQDNFGGKRIPVTIYAINGKRYTGTYFKSAGSYARVKALKK